MPRASKSCRIATCAEPGCPDDALPSASRCSKHESRRQAIRKAEGKTGERGSTHASRSRRQRVLERAGHCCFYCSAPATIADHYWPLAKGGHDNEQNLVAACEPCNAAKGDQAPTAFLRSDWLARRRKEITARR